MAKNDNGSATVIALSQVLVLSMITLVSRVEYSSILLETVF